MVWCGMVWYGMYVLTQSINQSINRSELAILPNDFPYILRFLPRSNQNLSGFAESPVFRTVSAHHGPIIPSDLRRETHQLGILVPAQRVPSHLHHGHDASRLAGKQQLSGVREYHIHHIATLVGDTR